MDREGGIDLWKQILETGEWFSNCSVAHQERSGENLVMKKVNFISRIWEGRPFADGNQTCYAPHRDLWQAIKLNELQNRNLAVDLKFYSELLTNAPSSFF